MTNPPPADQTCLFHLKLGTRPQGGESGGPILEFGISLEFGAPLLQLSLASFHKKYNQTLHQFRHELEVQLIHGV